MTSGAGWGLAWVESAVGRLGMKLRRTFWLGG